MTFRQRLMKSLYPLIMLFTKRKSNYLAAPPASAPAPVSFYDLPAVANNQQSFDMHSLQGKKVLVVNTASNCGFTGQYDELEKLYKEYNDKLIVIGFPANDFKEQEAGSDEDIAAFCKVNFGVTFPLMKKSTVVKTAEQNPVFQWLTDAKKNGWNDKQPEWNFSKYLVGENGNLLAYFPPTVSPMSEEVKQYLR